MSFKTAGKRHRRLLLAAGFSLGVILSAHAQTPPADKAAEAPEEAAADAGEVDKTDVAPENLDWSLLDVDASTLSLATPKARSAPNATASNDSSWSSNREANGTSAVTVKQSLTPFWDTRIGADMTVVNQPQNATSADVLRQKFAPDAAPSQSSGSAWAAATAPGVGSIWDRTSIEARVDPGSDQGRIGTSLTKAVPLTEQYSLTLQNGYNVIQQGIPVPGTIGHPSRTYETDQSARLSITDTGTSFIAGQTLSTTDDRWLRKFGAEQKLFDGVTVSGSIGETSSGATNKSISAGFKKSW
ncbi:hypothetical protein JQ628_20845 [Bradyrhizobium lablabi]|uniref:hypothetical protein n=1 Tax=Bradyrhizobium lablabi TaxID=722472 RepID=UPI001BAD9790|nr:hypothetical protein [Bradyrhizobium lablabi]MBR1123989.1 hypothetical protein [Bradyrhizobium lablabi]